MKKIYWTYRPEQLSSPYNLGGWVSMNGWYTPAMFLNNQFWDWNKAGLTNLVDNYIPENRYTAEIVPWIKKLTRFCFFEYNENYVDPIELQRSSENIGRRFDIAIQDIPTTIQWIKDNTDLVETTPGAFLVSNETIWINWEIIPAKYLTIN